MAGTHGIVYTPQPIVNFMVRSVDQILRNEFDRSLADDGVHVLDPFVGTGNFVTRVMREIKRTKLPHKYRDELYCNEVMLLPYYIASMNIEHAYYEATGEYEPFNGICFVDTFELAEPKTESLFTERNTERVQCQQDTPIFVVIGNPPYNAGQINENDNNKNRRENITDWALNEFREHYSDDSIDKWAIFHYVYGLLHHPGYRAKYEANLKRELPRIPFAPDFWAFANAGERLAELHVNYEDQDEYPLTELEDDDADFTYRVEKMKLSKDKTQLIYNDFLTLAGIPEKVYEYRLGNRSALEWIVDQYRVKTDKRSGIVHDPNDPDDPDYIVRLVKKIVTVSLETVEVVDNLPDEFE